LFAEASALTCIAALRRTADHHLQALPSPVWACHTKLLIHARPEDLACFLHHPDLGAQLQAVSQQAAAQSVYPVRYRT
jgi:hypothetical protein